MSREFSETWIGEFCPAIYRFFFEPGLLCHSQNHLLQTKQLKGACRGLCALLQAHCSMTLFFNFRGVLHSALYCFWCISHAIQLIPWPEGLNPCSRSSFVDRWTRYPTKAPFPRWYLYFAKKPDSWTLSEPSDPMLTLDYCSHVWTSYHYCWNGTRPWCAVSSQARCSLAHRWNAAVVRYALEGFIRFLSGLWACCGGAASRLVQVVYRTWLARVASYTDRRTMLVFVGLRR